MRASIHLQDTLQPNQTRDAPCPAEESICSFKSSSPIGHAFEGIGLGASSVGKGSASKSAASGSKFSTPGSNSLHESQNVGLQSTDADNVSIIATSFHAFKIIISRECQQVKTTITTTTKPLSPKQVGVG